MARLSDPIKQNSTAIRITQRFHKRMLDAADTARTVDLLHTVGVRNESGSTDPSIERSSEPDRTRERNGNTEQGTRETTGTAAHKPTGDPGITDAPEQVGRTDDRISEASGTATPPTEPTLDGHPDTPTQPPTETPPDQKTGGSPVVRAAGVYHFYNYGRRAGTSSWLYRWLTKEPEPEVIVIDLRDTWSVGPFLVRLEELIKEVTPATVSSALVRTGYRLRTRTLQRPIRIASIATIALILVAIMAATVSEGSVGAELFVLLGLLVLAVRGTQSTRSWDEITDTRSYEWLQTAFEPPAPPETHASDGTPHQPATVSTSGTGDPATTRTDPSKTSTTGETSDSLETADPHANNSDNGSDANQRS